MYLLIIALLELHTLLRIPLDLSPACLAGLSCVALYSLWYFDGKEYTGERRWEAFRRLSLWRWVSPVDVLMPEKSELQSVGGGKRLFVYTPCHTPSALIWSVGLHSGGVRFDHTTHYVLPPPLMWVPLVRDVLMWSGAVTYSTRDPRHSREAVILDLINQGRAVCYAPANFSHGGDDLEKAIEARYPSDDMLQKCMDNQIRIVPVVVQGEHDRYKMVHSDRLRAVQSFCHRHTDYPFPLCYWYRFYSHERPPLLSVQFSAVMASEVYESVEKLKQALKDRVARLAPPPAAGGQEKEIKGV